MANEFLKGLTTLAAERGVELDTLLTIVEESLLTAAKKAINASREVSVHIDRISGSIHCVAKLFIVEKVDRSEEQIALRDVQRRYPDYSEKNIGEEIDWEVTPEDFGRIAAQTTRQCISQKLRQAEKLKVCDTYRTRIGTLVSGEIKRLEHGEWIVSLDQVEAALRRGDRIPGEDFEPGDIITAVLTEIDLEKPGPCLCISRSCPEFVQKLFEREVAEINEHLVEIKAVAREAGYRSKIAVYTSEQRIDPVGACVGVRGSRVKTVVRELAGEKVDIIEWNPDIRVFVENALKPAKITKMDVNEARRSVRVEVPEDQLSLSIGRKGQNARLASKLTGWRVDVVKSEVTEVTQEEEFAAKMAKAVAALSSELDLDGEVASVLVQNGFTGKEIIADADVADLAALDGISEALAEEIKARAAR